LSCADVYNDQLQLQACPVCNGRTGLKYIDYCDGADGLPGLQKSMTESGCRRIFRRMRAADEPDSPRPELSASTSALLQEFLKQKEEVQNDPFAENWNLSQAWI